MLTKTDQTTKTIRQISHPAQVASSVEVSNFQMKNTNHGSCFVGKFVGNVLDPTPPTKDASDKIKV